MWQPIETAPKDGTQILVKTKHGYCVAMWNSETRGPGVSGHVQRPGWVACAEGDEVDHSGWDTGHGFSLEIDPLQWHPINSQPNS